MKGSRTLFWTVILLFFFAALVVWPTIPIKFSVGSFTYDKEWKGPNLEDLTGGRFEKKFDIHLGLDLKGGTYIVMRGDMTDVAEGERGDRIESTKEIIKNRVDQFGIAESNIYTSVVGEEYRIVVEIPGSGEDTETQIDVIKQVAKLEFYTPKAEDQVDLETDSTNLDNPLLLYFDTTNVSGSDLKDARARTDSKSGQGYEVVLEFSEEGAQKFHDLAMANLGQSIAIVLDEQIISNPQVGFDFGSQGGVSKFVTISGGGATGFSQEEAENLAIQLRGGALPVPVEVIQQRTIEPTLGQDSLNRSILAGIVGIILVMMFMLFLYRGAGLIADIALVLYIFFTLAVFKIFAVTLTLAGIAGFILSIGMAVDANVLIFERMLEEIREGKNKIKAIVLGFDRAWPSIRDSNVSTLITCTILYFFGSGIVRGFAITLALGVVVSLFTAVTVTRMLLRMAYSRQ